VRDFSRVPNNQGHGFMKTISFFVVIAIAAISYWQFIYVPSKEINQLHTYSIQINQIYSTYNSYDENSKQAKNNPPQSEKQVSEKQAIEKRTIKPTDDVKCYYDLQNNLINIKKLIMNTIPSLKNQKSKDAANCMVKTIDTLDQLLKLQIEKQVIVYTVENKKPSKTDPVEKNAHESDSLKKKLAEELMPLMNGYFTKNAYFIF
jgi:hypothetical protein